MEGLFENTYDCNGDVVPGVFSVFKPPSTDQKFRKSTVSAINFYADRHGVRTVNLNSDDDEELDEKERQLFHLEERCFKVRAAIREREDASAAVAVKKEGKQSVVEDTERLLNVRNDHRGLLVPGPRAKKQSEKFKGAATFLGQQPTSRKRKQASTSCKFH